MNESVHTLEALNSDLKMENYRKPILKVDVYPDLDEDGKPIEQDAEAIENGIHLNVHSIDMADAENGIDYKDMTGKLIHAVWGSSVYEPFETLLQKKEDFVETTLVDGKKYQVITMESAPIVISTSLYNKIYGRMPTDDFLLYVECDDTDLNYMLDEFYLALGQENRYSKFFHLFSIIEFVEKRYEDYNGANKLLASDEIEAITKAVMDISTVVDREKRNRVCGALKQTLGNLTDIGRKEKLVHILYQMGIREIKNCGTEFEIDDKTIGKLISLRNKCYHGDRKKADHSYMNIDLAVTQLMYLCEQIIIKQMKSTHERMV